VKGEVNFPGLRDELREIVRDEVGRALEIGGHGGYLSTKGAAIYLDKRTESGGPSTAAIDALVKRAN
jgi:hypothetical protein